MLTFTPNGDDGTPYQLSMTGSRAPPIAEAGLTMTPLTPSFTNTSGTQSQNFVLVGGHTETAFINMSQVAIFSLPQAAWTFVGVNQPIGDSKELLARDTIQVEPRSGHSAVLSEDGSRVVIFGGWVGDVNTPAQPQLAVLEIGDGYGGSGDWVWSIPNQQNPYSGGVYGHGAAMLPGNVMIVNGGRLISSNAKRDVTDDLTFFNLTSMQWQPTYINPKSPLSPAYTANAVEASSNLSHTERTGLGVGLGIGGAVLIGIIVFWLLCRRREKKRRTLREKELRALALGAERYMSPTPQSEYEYAPERRSASWHNMQERHIEGTGNWPLQNEAPIRMIQNNGVRGAERTGASLEIPSPTRGLRRSLHSRGAVGMFQPVPGGAPGSVFRIDEEEENSQPGSIKRSKTPKQDRSSIHSDPFKDPPRTADSEAEQRKKEVQTWVEDWQSAAESMHLSRNPSQATHDRTYSNLSQATKYSQSSSDPSGRGSPEKSDRTESNLSEKSAISIQKSTSGTVSRNLSQRSASAGYALFAGAAAAMSRMTGQREPDYGTTGITRFPSNRSVSAGVIPRRERADTLGSAKTTLIIPREDTSLLNRKTRDDYWTPPESPVKDKGRTTSLTKGLLGSVKRVFSGTSGVSVQDRVANFETKSEASSPTKSIPEMLERTPTETFWLGKQGAKDWDQPESSTSSHMIKRKPLPGQRIASGEEEDWDVESAVNRRVVQVMFTVPKEKLRVVNADALSLLSSRASDVDMDEERDREREVKRMSSVREGDEDVDEMDEIVKGKGKEPVRD
jgi:hypothetical protein